MRAIEFVIESATPILYHYSSVSAATEILTSGVFQEALEMEQKQLKEMYLKSI